MAWRAARRGRVQHALGAGQDGRGVDQASPLAPSPWIQSRQPSTEAAMKSRRAWRCRGRRRWGATPGRNRGIAVLGRGQDQVEADSRAIRLGAPSSGGRSAGFGDPRGRSDCPGGALVCAWSGVRSKRAQPGPEAGLVARLHQDAAAAQDGQILQLLAGMGQRGRRGSSGRKAATALTGSVGDQPQGRKLSRPTAKSDRAGGQQGGDVGA